MNQRTIESIEGKLCQVCGKDVDGGAPGNPRSCKECQWTHEIESAMHLLSRQHFSTTVSFPFVWKVIGDTVAMACVDREGKPSLVIISAELLSDWSCKHGMEVDQNNPTPSPAIRVLSERAYEDLADIVKLPVPF